MTLYLDSADMEACAPLLATGIFAGVTTNPLILARAGLGQQDLPAVYRRAVDAGARLVFMQTLGITSEAMAASGEELAGLGEAAVIKVPATAAGVSVATRLASQGIAVLLTAVYHPAQALAAREAHCRYIAPYVGRLDDAGRDGEGVCRDIARIAVGTGLEVVAASLRSLDVVGRLAAAGVESFTMGVPLANALLSEPLTVRALDEFESAWG